jgi:hypothetical protein
MRDVTALVEVGIGRVATRMSDSSLRILRLDHRQGHESRIDIEMAGTEGRDQQIRRVRCLRETIGHVGER